jgi:uncharacterized protein
VQSGIVRSGKLSSLISRLSAQNGLGVAMLGVSLMSLGDPDLARTIIQIYNDASMEYQEVSRNRIFNIGHLPFWDQTALNAEARRCIDNGIKGFVLPDTPERVGVPSFMSDY